MEQSAAAVPDVTASPVSLVPAAASSRDAALAAMRAVPKPRKIVTTDAGPFIVQGLSASERDAFEASLVVGRGKTKDVSTLNIRAKLVARSVVDGDGKRLFLDEDAVLLGQMPAKIIGPLYDAAQEMSSVSDEDVEDMAKNSASGPSDSSS